jgi:TolB-like protein
MMVLLAVVSVSAQKKDSLALLPFTGGAEGEGDYIVSEFARQRELRNAFNKVTLVTKTTRGFINFEHKFQRDSGMTDSDTVFELGKQIGAEYVISGYITKLGEQNLVMVSILSVESLQLVAGDYRAYGKIEEVDKLIPAMAKTLALYVQRNTSSLPGLSVPPFEVGKQVNTNDAQVLAQILAIQVANGKKYAVLPRTDSLDNVMEEHQRQRSGEVDKERIARLGAGRNAEYVLAGSVGTLGSLNKFTADVLNIEDGSFVDGYSEQYNAFAEGIELMPVLAAALNGSSHTLSPEESTPANLEDPTVVTTAPDAPASETASSVPSPEPAVATGGYSGGAKFGFALLNVMGGLGAYIQGDIGSGVFMTAATAAAVGLVLWEMQLEWGHSLVGGPGLAGIISISTSVLYGFIQPFVYKKAPALAELGNNLQIVPVVTPGTNEIGLSIGYKLDL